MDQDDNILSLRDLSAGYGKLQVFSSLDLDVKKNEVFGLIGLNGTGKTTLIKTILGLRQPFNGKIIVQGADIDHRKDSVSYLPERFEPPWFLSGFEFLQFSLNLYKKKITYDKAVEAANSVSLNADFLKKKVQSYSKGMRQKLGLLATVLTECPLLILDEPMSGLDPKARYEVKNLIHNVKKEGRCVFLSSHILSDMAELCDRVAVFHGGRFVFIGAPDEMNKQGKGKTLEESFLNLIEPQKLVA